MSRLIELARELRVASNSYELAESQEKRLDELFKDGRWNVLYTEEQYKELRNDSNKELGRLFPAFESAQRKLLEAALEQTRGDRQLAMLLVHEAKELEEKSYDAAFHSKPEPVSTSGSSHSDAQKKIIQTERAATIEPPIQAKSDLTPEQRLRERHELELKVAAANGMSVIKTAPAPTTASQPKSPDPAPEQKLLQRHLREAAARAPSSSPSPQKDIPIKSAPMEEKRIEAVQVDRWTRSESLEDIDFEDTPGGR